MNNLDTIGPDAAAVLARKGWTQGKIENNDGELCLTGALRACALQPGDWRIARAVARHLGHDEKWNDAYDRTREEVIDFLLSFKVLDHHLFDTFGPQWEAVVALARQAATLTPEQGRSLGKARNATSDAARDKARDAAETVARGAGRDSAWECAAWDTAGGAAGALVVSDLVGQHGLEQHHIDTLMAPWVSVMGDPRDHR